MTTAYTIYFAGELFSLKHLVGNALLADAIKTESAGQYECIVPQDLEQRESTAVAIRDQDLLHVAKCDIGLFHFDGPELDSGTVVEFMVAKMLDIPSVILRSDFRRGGDADDVRWNLMLVGYPRTEVVLLNSIELYQNHLRKPGLSAADAALQATKDLAVEVLKAIKKVQAQPSVLSPELREHVYTWFRSFTGGELSKRLSQDELQNVLQRKISKGLL